MLSSTRITSLVFTLPWLLAEYERWLLSFFSFFFLFVVNFVIHWNEKALGSHVFPIPMKGDYFLKAQSSLGFVILQFLVFFLSLWMSLQSPLLAPPLLTIKPWTSWTFFHFSTSATFIWHLIEILYFSCSKFNWSSSPTTHSLQHTSKWSLGG